MATRPKSERRRERSTSRYQKARLGFLAKNPLCKLCLDRGITEPATELDHVIPVSENPDGFWDRKNWQGLCRPCHEEKTANENSGEFEEQRKWREHVESLLRQS